MYGLPILAGLKFAESIALPSIARWWDEKFNSAPTAPSAPQNTATMMS
jgi:hypothetical protein